MSHQLPLQDLFTASLLNSFAGKESKKLVEYLPDEKREEILKGLEAVKGTKGFSPAPLIEPIHFTWLVEPIKSFSKPLQNIIVETLPEKSGKAIKKELKLKGSNKAIPKAAVCFLHHLLEKKTRPEDIYPLFLLDESALTPLLHASSSKLNELIHLLGIEDLAREIPSIIDKKILKNVYDFLSEEEKAFAKKKVRSEDILKLPKLNIGSWEGDHKKLETILHKRGLAKLAVAIKGESKHFQWHLLHHLDTGRGKILEKGMEKKAETQTIEKLKKGVVEAMHFIK